MAKKSKESGATPPRRPLSKKQIWIYGVRNTLREILRQRQQVGPDLKGPEGWARAIAEISCGLRRNHTTLEDVLEHALFMGLERAIEPDILAAALKASMRRREDEDGTFPPPDAFGRWTRLTRAEREQLGETNVGSVDETADQRRKRKDAERKAAKRLADGARPRSKSAERLKPWVTMGTSRSSYYRNKSAIAASFHDHNAKAAEVLGRCVATSPTKGGHGPH